MILLNASSPQRHLAQHALLQPAVKDFKYNSLTLLTFYNFYISNYLIGKVRKVQKRGQERGKQSERMERRQKAGDHVYSGNQDS